MLLEQAAVQMIPASESALQVCLSGNMPMHAQSCESTSAAQHVSMS